jgi:hypothetical protein
MMREKGREGENYEAGVLNSVSVCVCVCMCVYLCVCVCVCVCLRMRGRCSTWLNLIVAISKNFFCIKLCTLVVIYTISLMITSKLSVAKRSILQQRVSKFMLNQFHEIDLLM